jgi:hypothetical protein
MDNSIATTHHIFRICITANTGIANINIQGVIVVGCAFVGWLSCALARAVPCVFAFAGAGVRDYAGFCTHTCWQALAAKGQIAAMSH